MACVEHDDFSIAMFLASVFSSEIFHNVIIRNFLQSCSVPSASETNYHLELEILLKLYEIPETEGMISGAEGNTLRKNMMLLKKNLDTERNIAVCT